MLPAKPKVLAIVTYTVFPPLMGGQKGVALFYQFLRNYCDVFIAASKENSPDEEVKVFPFLFSNKFLFLNVFYLQRLKKEIKKNKIDVLILEHSYPAWMGFFLRRWTGVHYIIHAHNLEAERFRLMKKWWWRLYAQYEGWAMRQADFIFFISEEDRAKAAAAFTLDAAKSSVITYGIEEQEIHFTNETVYLSHHNKLLFFNGTLDYEPNYEAVKTIVEKIDPLLQEKLDKYEIIITGNRTPASFQTLIADREHIRFLGFVADVSAKYKMADLFLNPVLNDSGIKTKVVEAIACGCTVISTESGASGINKKVCGDKLVIVADNDWHEFVNQIVLILKEPKKQTPHSFFEFYSWENITKKAAENIYSLLQKNV